MGFSKKLKQQITFKCEDCAEWLKDHAKYSAIAEEIKSGIDKVRAEKENQKKESNDSEEEA